MHFSITFVNECKVILALFIHSFVHSFIPEYTYNHLHLRLLIVRGRDWSAGYVPRIIALSSRRAGTVVAPNGVGAGIVDARTMLGRGITLIDVCTWNNSFDDANTS